MRSKSMTSELEELGKLGPAGFWGVFVNRGLTAPLFLPLPDSHLFVSRSG